jgi:SWI/SNF-related matrix-associated actin-dependent regulator 1 of chromatin subfamily A
LVAKLKNFECNLIEIPKQVFAAVEKFTEASDDGTSFDFSEMPAELTTGLLKFQWDTVRFAIARKGRLLVADDMGLGKTIQAVAIASCYKYVLPKTILREI